MINTNPVTVCFSIPEAHFVDYHEMVDHGIRNPIFKDSGMVILDFQRQAADNPRYIRPLAVRPLNNPEGVPTPWGFSVSCPSASMSGGRH